MFKKTADRKIDDTEVYQLIIEKKFLLFQVINTILHFLS